MVGAFVLEAALFLAHIPLARAHGMWTYEPRQGRKAATVVCSTSAVVTLAFLIYDLRWTIYDGYCHCKTRANRKS
jgi:hypothetical protein